MHRQMSEIGQEMLIWKCQLKPSIFRVYLVYSVGSIRPSYAKKPLYSVVFGPIRSYSYSVDEYDFSTYDPGGPYRRCVTLVRTISTTEL